MKLTANGYLQTTVVTGTTYTGLVAADGSTNIVIVPGTSIVGRYHACGALNAVVVSGTSPVGRVHACGALNVIIGSLPSSGITHPSGALQVSNAVPTFVPSLDSIFADITFDFTQKKAWVSNTETTPSAALSVTRATTTSYGRDSAGVYVPYAANTLRYDDVLGGVLIEEARTNICLQSSSLDNASWIKPADVTITANNDGSIFGGSTADMITCDGTGGGGLYQLITVTPSTTYTWSFFAKLGTMAAADYKFAVYDNTNLAFIGANIVPSPALTTTGWTRVTYTFTTPALCVAVRVYPLRNGSAISGTAYVDQCQLELGSFATSPIPTTSAAASRAADRIVCDQSLDFGPNGTMLIEWTGATTATYAQTSVVGGLVNTSAPAFNDSIYSAISPGATAAGLTIIKGGVSQATQASRAPLVIVANKLCAAWTSGRSVRALNGAFDVSTGLNGIPNTAQNRIVVGSASWNSGNYMNCVARRLALWNTTRSDAAVQGATA